MHPHFATELVNQRRQELAAAAERSRLFRRRDRRAARAARHDADAA